MKKSPDMSWVTTIAIRDKYNQTLYHPLPDEEYALQILAGHPLCLKCHGTRTCACDEIGLPPHGCSTCLGLGVAYDD